ncbi:hypothetical protein Tco_1319791 [Tanacetum coccineum]
MRGSHWSKPTRINTCIRKEAHQEVGFYTELLIKEAQRGLTHRMPRWQSVCLLNDLTVIDTCASTRIDTYIRKEAHQEVGFYTELLVKEAQRGLTHRMPRWQSVCSLNDSMVIIEDPMIGNDWKLNTFASMDLSFLDDKLKMEKLMGLLLAYPCDKLEL